MGVVIHIGCQACAFRVRLASMVPARMEKGRPVPAPDDGPEEVVGFYSEHLCPACFAVEPVFHPIREATTDRSRANVQGLLSYLEASPDTGAGALKEDIEDVLAGKGPEGDAYLALLDRFEALLEKDRDRVTIPAVPCAACGTLCWSPDDVVSAFRGVMREGGCAKSAPGVACPRCGDELVWGG